MTKTHDFVRATYEDIHDLMKLKTQANALFQQIDEVIDRIALRENVNIRTTDKEVRDGSSSNHSGNSRVGT